MLHQLHCLILWDYGIICGMRPVLLAGRIAFMQPLRGCLLFPDMVPYCLYAPLPERINIVPKIRKDP